eukprot:CAMPEP_0204402256 /NCGR_PEP_ID=MMETSP0470-20130426/5202_1 /ASSEMBLY_ACC=CAM_ASM_000385 /TAXON_ID=2969 /ORGANISM="Oxyrrhis marina" /LENGTH=82 /DNA_ID=CAMNT_0051397331 /DNA_START=15 /DNA_END=262 /DNA_ORIENTATION=+
MSISIDVGVQVSIGVILAGLFLSARISALLPVSPVSYHKEPAAGFSAAAQFTGAAGSGALGVVPNCSVMSRAPPALYVEGGG